MARPFITASCQHPLLLVARSAAPLRPTIPSTRRRRSAPAPVRQRQLGWRRWLGDVVDLALCARQPAGPAGPGASARVQAASLVGVAEAPTCSSPLGGTLGSSRSCTRVETPPIQTRTLNSASLAASWLLCDCRRSTRGQPPSWLANWPRRRRRDIKGQRLRAVGRFAALQAYFQVRCLPGGARCCPASVERRRRKAFAAAEAAATAGNASCRPTACGRRPPCRRRR